MNTAGSAVSTSAGLRIGIVGAGVISAQYLATIARLQDLRLTAVADLDLQRARAAAEPHGARALTVEQLVEAEDVDVVLNLTIPAAHAEITLAAVAAGKHVYGEKPLAANTAEGHQMLTAAQEAGLVVGCAPDTFLGTGVQTARHALDDGVIGTPVSATATMVTPGHERWHPHPDFYYQPGGGPLLDMGPYYITALMTLLGPVSHVMGATSALRKERIIGSGPRAGEQIPVRTASHVTGILIHTSGAISTLVTSFDGTATQAAPIEIHGTEGSLAVPDPNTFGGTVSAITTGHQWQQLPVAAGYRQAARGYGLADLYWSGAFTGAPQAGRARGELGLHVLEVMESVLLAAETSQAVTLTTSVQRAAAVALDPR
ncbi:Gfo/Idh/MocA family protein [Nesterenkonia alba]|uniref:Gfo/Idh/MocA family protein n=1 Tax=Nesterenkonia alba TaxID=515814 RepID=UPI0003B502C2|nr:Gfo/Idh/MocA family oxidoreductase [Nesterenkonia alba]